MSSSIDITVSRHLYALTLLASLAPALASAYAEPPPELRTQVFKLVQEGSAASNPMARNSPHADARSALLRCENAERTGQGVEGACSDAQQKVARCQEFVASWRGERTEALQRVDAWAASVGEPVGQEYSDASNLRGLGKRRDSAMLWNDNVKILRGMEIKGCPAELPGSSRTPEQILAEARDGKSRKRSRGEQSTDDSSYLFKQSTADMKREIEDPRLRDERLRAQAERDATAREAQNRIQAAVAQRVAASAGSIATLPASRTAPAIPPSPGGATMPGSAGGAPESIYCSSSECPLPPKECNCLCQGGTMIGHKCSLEMGSAPTTAQTPAAYVPSSVQQPAIQPHAATAPGAAPVSTHAQAPAAHPPSSGYQPVTQPYAAAAPSAPPDSSRVTGKTLDGTKNCVELVRQGWEGDYYKAYFVGNCDGLWIAKVTVGDVTVSRPLNGIGSNNFASFFRLTVERGNGELSWRYEKP